MLGYWGSHWPVPQRCKLSENAQLYNRGVRATNDLLSFNDVNKSAEYRTP